MSLGAFGATAAPRGLADPIWTFPKPDEASASLPVSASPFPFPQRSSKYFDYDSIRTLAMSNAHLQRFDLLCYSGTARDARFWPKIEEPLTTCSVRHFIASHTVNVPLSFGDTHDERLRFLPALFKGQKSHVYWQGPRKLLTCCTHHVITESFIHGQPQILSQTSRPAIGLGQLQFG